MAERSEAIYITLGCKCIWQHTQCESKNDWRCGESKPGLSACKADKLLSSVNITLSNKYLDFYHFERSILHFMFSCSNQDASKTKKKSSYTPLQRTWHRTCSNALSHWAVSAFGSTPNVSQKTMEMRGVEPRTFRMQSGRATTVPHPLIFVMILVQKYPFIKCLC